MPRPTSKQELINLATEKYNKMWKMIDALPDQLITFEFDGKEAHWKRDKNIRDILIHLYEWHNLLLNWVDSNTKGKEKQFLRESYNWKTYGDMNIEFWKEHQKTSYETAKELLNDSHKKVLELLEKFTDKELFNKGIFPWVGGSTLGSYFISTTSSHYDWAINKIKKI